MPRPAGGGGRRRAAVPRNRSGLPRGETPRTAAHGRPEPAVAAAQAPAPRGRASIRGPGGLSHLDPEGTARMVDVTEKAATAREARARATIRMQPATLRAVRRGAIAKGDVLGVARLAGIMADKRTADWIPLCHPLRLTGIEVRFVVDRRRAAIHVQTAVRTIDRTGVEMEALTAAAAAGLTLYDMVKAIDRAMVLTDVCLVEKTGGRSGHWTRPDAARSR